MILKGNEDLRVVKTIEGIKAAFEKLICEKDYGKITVKELCDRARINKKTFYHYYETLEALLVELKMEFSNAFVERIKSYSLPEDLEKVNREFFEYSIQQGYAYERITCSGSYRPVKEEMMENSLEVKWGQSEIVQKLSDFEKILLISYVNSTVLTVYRKWVENGKTIPTESIIAITNSIVQGGVGRYLEYVSK